MVDQPGHGRLVLVVGVLLVAALGADRAWGKPERAEVAAAQAVDEAAAAERSAAAAREKACSAAREAESAAIEGRKLDLASWQLLVVVAGERRAACTEHELKQRAAALARERAEQALPRPAAGASAPSDTAMGALVDKAQTVQGRLDKLRAQINAAVFDDVDKGTLHALKLTEAKDAERARQAARLQELAMKSRDALHEAQKAANELVEHALRLKPCLIGAGAERADCRRTAPLHHDAATKADTRFEESFKAASDRREALVAAELELRIAGLYKSDAQRTQAADFERLLKDYPDARAPFAEDSFQILAGRKSEASIQVVSERLRANGFGTWSLRLTRPLGSESETDVFGSADGLANGRKLTVAFEGVSLRGRLFGQENVLFATSLSASAGPKDLEYYPDDASAFTAGKKTTTVNNSEFAIALAIHQVKTRNAHLLSLKAQRTHDPAKSRIRCPAGGDGDLAFANCLQGSFGLPTENSATVLGYEYRYQKGDYAFSAALDYNSRSEVWSIGLPLYFVRSADDPKRPLNAGLRIDWSSKGKAAITGRDRNLWSWGVFVGAPFRLFSGPGR